MSSTSRPTQVAKIFYSYSHKDEALRDELEAHLASLKRSGEISEWHDRKIGAGAEWESEITENLESAHIILLLISSDFIASDYSCKIETTRAMERHAAGEALVIPILLRPVHWQHLPFGKLQALPANAKPVTSWTNRDEAFASIADGVARQLAKIASLLRSGSRISARKSNKPEIGTLLPYLCDRSDQEIALDLALQHARRSFERRPFIAIVHGDEYECHDMFYLRLKQVSLLRLLNLSPDSSSIEEDIRLETPPLSITALDQALQWFHRNLGEQLVKTRDASDEDLLNSISNYSTPVLVSSYLPAELWNTTRFELRDAFIKFWNAFQDLPPGRILIACLFIKYKRTEKMGFLARRQHNKLNTQTRTALNELDFTRYDKIHGVVLPELRGVQEHHVEDWIREGRNFRGLCQIHDRSFCDVQGSIEAIRTLYNRVEYAPYKGQIPMEFLAKNLIELLEEHRC